MPDVIPTSEHAIARIRAFAAHKKWKPSRYAIEAGLGANSLRDFDRADWNPTLDTIEKLEAIIPADFGRLETSASAIVSLNDEGELGASVDEFAALSGREVLQAARHVAVSALPSAAAPVLGEAESSSLRSAARRDLPEGR